MNFQHRQDRRLSSYDYSTPGAYFVTACTADRRLLFQHPRLKEIVLDEWFALPSRFSNIRLDCIVVMPNHIHFVVWLLSVGALQTPAEEHVGAGLAPVPERPATRIGTLGQVVGTFKSRVSVRWLGWLKANDPTGNGELWQRNYYDRVIRHDEELSAIRAYIENNPREWAFDHENLDRVPDAAYESSWKWLERPDAK